jgi:hypothetical protein
MTTMIRSFCHMQGVDVKIMSNAEAYKVLSIQLN